MRRPLFIVPVLVVAGVLSFVAYRQHQVVKARRALAPIIQNISIRTTENIKLDTDESRVTYAEYFARIERDLTEIDSKLIDLQATPAPFSKDEASLALAYGRSCQELLRSLSLKYRKQLDWGSALDVASDAIDELRDADYYGREYAQKRVDDAVEEAGRKGQDLEKAVRDAIESGQTLERKCAPLAGTFAERYIVDKQLLAKFRAKNQQDLETLQPMVARVRRPADQAGTAD